MTDKTPPTASSLSLCKAQKITNYLYIGRRSTRGNMPESIWRNPFVVSTDGTPKQCLDAYEAYVRNNANLMRQIPDLAGKTLACWCKSKRTPDAPCHGDVLVKLFQEWATLPNNPIDTGAVIEE